jgi:hypothetical protein
MRLFIARIACGSLAATLAFGAAVLPARVGAQTPPYATPGSGPAIGGETIHGVIEAIEGAYRILVRDDRGFVDDVTLRQGTIINPRGLRLRVGMSVTISGFASGSTFSAVEIDAPYSYDGGAAGSTYYSTYPDYGYGYGYGDYYVGSPAESVTVIQQPIVGQPPPGAVRRVEPPHANRPLRHPLDGKVDPPLPPYVVPPTAFRAVPMPGRSGSAPDRAWTVPDRSSSAPDRASSAPDRAQAAAPQYRAPAPEYRAPAAPEYHAPPPPPAPRSEPAPAPRENREPSSPTRPH